ncbi:MAG: hypothetical protein ACI92O_000377 [Colwellia sp.]|jgi:hypothetical protein
MTIFITCREFYKKSATILEQRPWSLELIDDYLADYHRAKSLPYSDDAVAALLNLDKYIKLWAKDKKTRIVKGKKRYRNYRDRHGVISTLEEQVKLTYAEYCQGYNDLENFIAARMGRRNTIFLSEPPSSFGPSIVPPLPYRPKRMGGHDSFDSSWLRPVSLGSFELYENKSDLGSRVSSTSSVESMESVSEKLIEFDAYETAAEMINTAIPLRISSSMKKREKVSAKDVQRSVQKRGPSLNLFDLYRGMQQLNKDVFYESHCSINHITAVLSHASSHNPVLICVRNNSTINRLLICSGLKYTGEGVNQRCSYLVKDTRAFTQNATLELNGDYCVDVGSKQEHYKIVVNLGYIKMQF